MTNPTPCSLYPLGGLPRPCLGAGSARRRPAERGALPRQSLLADAKAEPGFTLVELMLVLVILAILAGLVLPKFAGRQEQARETAAVTQIATFNTALGAYEVDTGSYPSTQAGLRALVVQPSDVSGWRGPYLESDIPADPWQHPYVYEYPGKLNPSGYDIISMGQDGQLGTADDIHNAGITSK